MNGFYDGQGRPHRLVGFTFWGRVCRFFGFRPPWRTAIWEVTVKGVFRQFAPDVAWGTAYGTFLGNVDDGYVYCNDDHYSHAHAGTGDLSASSTSTTVMIGQQHHTAESPFGYSIYRGVLWYNTLGLARNSIVRSGTVRLYCSSIYAESGYWLVTLRKFTGSKPPIAADFTAYTGGTGGSETSDDIVASTWFEITLNATSLSWVEPDDYTVMGVQSDKDLASLPPGTDDREYVTVRSANYADSAYHPQLVLRYTLGGPGPAVGSPLVF